MTLVQAVVPTQDDVVASVRDFRVVSFPGFDVDIFERPVMARCDFTT